MLGGLCEVGRLHRRFPVHTIMVDVQMFDGAELGHLSLEQRGFGLLGGMLKGIHLYRGRSRDDGGSCCKRHEMLAMAVVPTTGKGRAVVPVAWVGMFGTGGFSACAACILAVAASDESEKCRHLSMLKRRVAGVACWTSVGESGCSMGLRPPSWLAAGRAVAGRSPVWRSSTLEDAAALEPAWSLLSLLRKSVRTRSSVLRRREGSGMACGSTMHNHVVVKHRGNDGLTRLQ